MRFLVLHVNSFRCEITTKGRSKVYEDYEDPGTAVDEALVVLASVERGDERDPALVAQRAATEVRKLSAQLKVTTIVLHPFAHLFAALSTPEVAIDILHRTEQELRNADTSVHGHRSAGLTPSRLTAS